MGNTYLEGKGSFRASKSRVGEPHLTPARRAPGVTPQHPTNQSFRQRSSRVRSTTDPPQTQTRSHHGLGCSRCQSHGWSTRVGLCQHSLPGATCPVMRHLVRTQHSTAQYSTAQHSSAQHSSAQLSTAQYSTAQYSTAQYSTARLSIAQLSLPQLSTAQLESATTPTVKVTPRNY